MGKEGTEHVSDSQKRPHDFSRNRGTVQFSDIDELDEMLEKFNSASFVYTGYN